MLITAMPELDDAGKAKRWVGTCTDVHERIVAQNALAEKQELYRSVLEASADCIKIMCPEGRLRLMNPPGLKLMELDEFETIEGRHWCEFWPIEMREQVRQSVRDAKRGRTVRFSGLCPTASGKAKWWDVVVTPIRDSAGEITGILSISRDSTTEREKSEELQWASEHDALTSLPNRRAFQKRLQAAVFRSMRKDSKVGLLLIDLDHFKHVNDTLGHAAGDSMLKEIARRLKSSLRSADFFGRLGGDEFAIVVENVSSSADLMVVGEKAMAALKAPLRLQGRALSGGASIGGALFPDDADTANELFKLADTALYALKAEGRGGTKLFHSYMREEAQRVASQLSLARIAVNEASVSPYYQPKIELADGRVAGFEALLRWAHPSKGLQMPDTIEEAFKDYELASKIGGLMQKRVLADARRWRAQNLGFGRISINAAPAEFLRDDYAERLLARLEDNELPPSLVEIEVTEHVLMASGSKFVHRALAMLKAAGVTIALDDFGTGYSSLSHLRDFPVDVVKIDKSFVQRMLEDAEIAAIVAAVINLAKSLRIVSVAEGIETEEQAEMLKASGCNLAQGYLLGAPQPAELVAASLQIRAAA
jgi:diguanylate cyclase (GGDEF)-like protein/PAS domain S-box-containing protein